MPQQQWFSQCHAGSNVYQCQRWMPSKQQQSTVPQCWRLAGDEIVCQCRGGKSSWAWGESYPWVWEDGKCQCQGDDLDQWKEKPIGYIFTSLGAFFYRGSVCQVAVKGRRAEWAGGRVLSKYLAPTVRSRTHAMFSSVIDHSWNLILRGLKHWWVFFSQWTIQPLLQAKQNKHYLPSGNNNCYYRNMASPTKYWNLSFVLSQCVHSVPRLSP